MLVDKVVGKSLWQSNQFQSFGILKLALVNFFSFRWSFFSSQRAATSGATDFASGKAATSLAPTSGTTDFASGKAATSPAATSGDESGATDFEIGKAGTSLKGNEGPLQHAV